MIKTSITLHDLRDGSVSYVGGYSYMAEAKLFGSWPTNSPVRIGTEFGNGLDLTKYGVYKDGVIYKQPSSSDMPILELYLYFV